MAYKLSIKALAIAGAIFWGAVLFLTTLLAALGVKTIWISKEAVAMWAWIYPGLTATVGGAFIGLLYGLFCGAICGGIFGWLYNRFVK